MRLVALLVEGVSQERTPTGVDVRIDPVEEVVNLLTIILQVRVDADFPLTVRLVKRASRLSRKVGATTSQKGLPAVPLEELVLGNLKLDVLSVEPLVQEVDHSDWCVFLQLSAEEKLRVHSHGSALDAEDRLKVRYCLDQIALVCDNLVNVLVRARKLVKDTRVTS